MAAVPLVAFGADAQPPSPLRVAMSGHPYCSRGDPLAGVPAPHRFTVQSPCVTVSGTVSAVSPGAGGAVDIELTGVPRKLLLPGNDGRLVFCRMPAFSFSLPPLGSRVTVVGPLVTDPAGHSEVLPVWHIAVAPAAA